MQGAIASALQAAEAAGVTGKEITPFLLSHVSEVTEGRSLAANIGLLEQNAQVAARIAAALVRL
jgi:pseudouridine-5'-phosphate glycosidase